MKKGHGLKRMLPVIDRTELEGMPTGALLARLKRLRWCEDDPQGSDLTPHEIAQADGNILFKSDHLWKAAYADVKAILATREHIERRTG
ncbi:MAG: hypothetical protein AAFR64_05500 [Pseudomonadota bacterium]